MRKILDFLGLPFRKKEFEEKRNPDEVRQEELLLSLMEKCIRQLWFPIPPRDRYLLLRRIAVDNNSQEVEFCFRKGDGALRGMFLTARINGEKVALHPKAEETFRERSQEIYREVLEERNKKVAEENRKILEEFEMEELE